MGKSSDHEKGQKDYKKCGGQADSNPITEFFHPSYKAPSDHDRKEQYDKGWGNAKEQHESSSSSVCFITTACVEAAQLPDDCLELTTLRNFRETYVRSLPKGNEMLEEYQRIAPHILEKINAQPQRQQIYAALFQRVRTSVESILAGKPQEAFENYKNVVAELKAQYL